LGTGPLFFRKSNPSPVPLHFTGTSLKKGRKNYIKKIIQ